MRCHPLLGRASVDGGLPPLRTATTNPRIGQFGWTRSEAGKPKAHKGVDELCPVGWPCHAAHDGHVSRSYLSSTYGECVYVSDGAGLESRYAHLSARLVKAGDAVKAGDLLGLTGKSGNAAGASIPPHLHWEVRIDDVPIDPRKWLQGIIDSLPELPGRGV